MMEKTEDVEIIEDLQHWKLITLLNVCRFVQIKAKYDPESLFGSEEQGIPPALPGC